MLSKRNILIMMFCLFFILTASSCFPTGNSKNNLPQQTPTSDDSFSDPNIIDDSTPTDVSPDLSVPSSPSIQNPILPNELIEGLLFIEDDVKIIIPENELWKKASATHKLFTEDVLENAFMDNREVTRIDRMENAFVEDALAIGYEFADGSSFFSDGGYVNYGTTHYRNKDYSLVIQDSYAPFIRPDLGDIFTKKSIDGLDKDAAVALVRDVTDKLGITVAETEAVYSLDYETLVSEWEPGPPEMPNIPWEKGDEAYVIVLTATLGDMPITDEEYHYSELVNLQVTGSRIRGIVTRDGLISFVAYDIYEVTGPTENAGGMVDLNEALRVVTEKYEKLILTNPIYIHEISAEIVPICTNISPYEFNLTPCWVITATQPIETKTIGLYAPRFSIIVNGITGDEVRSR